MYFESRYVQIITNIFSENIKFSETNEVYDILEFLHNQYLFTLS